MEDLKLYNSVPLEPAPKSLDVDSKIVNTSQKAVNNYHFVWLKAFTIPVIIVLVIGTFAFLSGRNKLKPADWVYIHAGIEKQAVNLPDGSRILLRKGSSIAYPSDYGKMLRLVQLTGEAFFEIKENASIPFQLKVYNEITANSGTSFLVRSNDSMEMVLVSKGQVTVNNNTDKKLLVLHEGQKAEIIGNKVALSTANMNDFAWTNEQLVFNHISLKQVAEDLKNFYGVSIYFAEDLHPESIHITAQFDNQPLLRILDVIVTQTNLSIKKVSDSVLITKETAKHNEVKPFEVLTFTEKKKKNWIRRIFEK